ncbi:hypothetical protein [Metabacillus fastidiosus]|uniref:Transposase n=1 Tax=Metabacillus fastidiosus TaxID=1458 RepID=A0ABU6NS60_9BACI|nr:hypothetical protein [Metabacillus fastidiosus]
MGAVYRRKRLPDGSFGELEKVFEGETNEEKLTRFEAEKLALQQLLLDNMDATAILFEEILLLKGGA